MITTPHAQLPLFPARRRAHDVSERLGVDDELARHSDLTVDGFEEFAQRVSKDSFECVVALELLEEDGVVSPLWRRAFAKSNSYAGFVHTLRISRTMASNGEELSLLFACELSSLSVDAHILL